MDDTQEPGAVSGRVKDSKEKVNTMKYPKQKERVYLNPKSEFPNLRLKSNTKNKATLYSSKKR